MKRKQIMFLWLCSLFCFFELKSFAQELDGPLFSPGSDFSGTSEFSDRSRFELRGVGGLFSSNYSLSSSSQRISLARDMGVFFSGDFRVRFDRKIDSLGFKYRRSQVSFSGISGVTPSVVDVTRQELALYLLFKLNRDLKLGAGFLLYDRDATVTTPNATVNSSLQIGPQVFLEHAYRLSRSLKLESLLSFSMPWIYREFGIKSGYPNLGYQVELGAKVFYPLSNSFDLGIGAAVKYDSQSFDGTGPRAIQDASENSLLFYFPLEIRFRF